MENAQQTDVLMYHDTPGQTCPVEAAPLTPTTCLEHLKKEETIITKDLKKKLQTNANGYIPHFSAPFYWKLEAQRQHELPLTHHQCAPNPTEKEWEWYNGSYVKLPFSKFYRWYSDPKWHYIVRQLTNLRTWTAKWIQNEEVDITEGITEDDNDDDGDCTDKFVEVITAYCGEARHACNFKVIKEDQQLKIRLMYVLPGIIDHALKLPCRLEGSIPILKRGQCRTICLSRDLACSLLANAFLCTFPEQDGGRNLPYFNFYTLYNSSEDPGKTELKREKLKCILDYFDQMSLPTHSRTHPNSVITFERRHYPSKFNWATSTDNLCPVKITANEKLEEANGMLQVDFANRQIGGGILNSGAVQEEIRFCISPELICARLFTESLNNDEVLVITGTSQFSSYSGYSSTFKYEKKVADAITDAAAVDNLGRQYTQVVAMDAIHFQPHETQSQYWPEKIKRELHKCNVAFTQGKHSTPVATGNWGCGAFNGDPQLKFLIQWMAASVHKRDGMLFHGRDEWQKNECEKIAQLLIFRRTNVGWLFNMLMAYESECISWGRRSAYGVTVFQFVEKVVEGMW